MRMHAGCFLECGNGGGDPYADLMYRNMAIVLELIDLIVILFFGTMKNVLKRGYYIEFI